jgi:hypothetical protein
MILESVGVVQWLEDIPSQWGFSSSSNFLQDGLIVQVNTPAL